MARSRKAIKPMKYPIGYEYQYRLAMRWLNSQMRIAVKHHLHPIVPKMVAEVTDVSLPSGGSIRQDAWADDLSRSLRRIARDMQKPTNATIKRVQELGPKVDDHNKAEWKRLIRSQYGVNPTSEDPKKYKDLLDTWSTDNSLLIKDVPEETLSQIATTTVDALQSGKSIPEMQSSVVDAFGERLDVQASRANLIARDQIAKLNGKLTKQRQDDVGVEKYIWRTVGDERVRETHAMAEGNIYSWDMPPMVTNGNHPGDDYQCRCWPEPILPEVLAFEAFLFSSGDEEEAA